MMINNEPIDSSKHKATVIYTVSAAHGNHQSRDFIDATAAARSFHEIDANDRPLVIRVRHSPEFGPGGSGQVIATTAGKGKAGQVTKYWKYSGNQDAEFDAAYRRLTVIALHQQLVASEQSEGNSWQGQATDIAKLRTFFRQHYGARITQKPIDYQEVFSGILVHTSNGNGFLLHPEGVVEVPAKIANRVLEVGERYRIAKHGLEGVYEVIDRDAVERLKHSWMGKPAWHLADTFGFEPYREELDKFSREIEAHWKKERKQIWARTAESAVKKHILINEQIRLSTSLQSEQHPEAEKLIGALPDHVQIPRTFFLDLAALHHKLWHEGSWVGTANFGQKDIGPLILEAMAQLHINPELSPLLEAAYGEINRSTSKSTQEARAGSFLAQARAEIGRGTSIDEIQQEKEGASIMANHAADKYVVVTDQESGMVGLRQADQATRSYFGGIPAIQSFADNNPDVPERVINELLARDGGYTGINDCRDVDGDLVLMHKDGYRWIVGNSENDLWARGAESAVKQHEITDEQIQASYQNTSKTASRGPGR